MQLDTLTPPYLELLPIWYSSWMILEGVLKPANKQPNINKLMKNIGLEARSSKNHKEYTYMIQTIKFLEARSNNMFFSNQITTNQRFLQKEEV